MNDVDDPFRDYHRVRSWGRIRRVVGVLCLCIGLASAWGLAASFAPPPITAASATTTGIPNPNPQASAVALETSALPAPAASVPPEEVPASAPALLPQAGASTWAIHIDTTGYQAEINRCLWVRMDLGTPAPIVGAHNFCGGGQVLQMAIGDTVALSGTGLDGTYVVSDSRDAHSGENAFTATSGMAATVILQTCYWANNGTERLVGLTRVG